ncbi:MAG: efflux transporter outer membrane subunit [Tabrizicola sp.]|nr:efflux transporter outer membrane subunit [Tabrizicola sp.]
MAISVVLAGCSTETPYNAPLFAFGGSYSSTRASAPVLVANSAWWVGFKDPVLDKLIARALQSNLDLAAARERIVEAQANLGQVSPNLSLSPSVSATREKAVGGTPFTRGEASLGLSWLLDPYGARRQQIKAAGARVEVADAEVDAARLLILFNASNAYVDLRYFQRVLAIRHQEIRARSKTLTLVRTLLDQNSATRLDVVRAEARLSEAQAAVPTAEVAVRAQQYLIAGLLGVPPGGLDIGLGDSGKQPRPGMSVDVGIPADLLRNRPDIRIAERLYYASVAEVGVAKAALYPTLSLTGSISLNSIRGNEGSSYVFGPSLTLPSLPTDARRAAVRARESRARQALIAWKAAVTDALGEVETAIVRYSANAAAVGSSQKTVGLYREAVDLTRDLITRDGATIRDLLDAEESVVDADLVLAENRRQLARSFIELNVGLGSGHAVGNETTEPVK